MVNRATHVKIIDMETTHTTSNQKPVTHESYLRHRRQSTWQIFLPIIIGSLLVLAAAVLVFLPVVGVSTGVNSSQYADTSLVWLILPVLFLAVLIAFFMIGLIIVW